MNLTNIKTEDLNVHNHNQREEYHRRMDKVRSMKTEDLDIEIEEQRKERYRRYDLERNSGTNTKAEERNQHRNGNGTGSSYVGSAEYYLAGGNPP